MELRSRKNVELRLFFCERGVNIIGMAQQLLPKLWRESNSFPGWLHFAIIFDFVKMTNVDINLSFEFTDGEAFVFVQCDEDTRCAALLLLFHRCMLAIDNIAVSFFSQTTKTISKNKNYLHHLSQHHLIQYRCPVRHTRVPASFVFLAFLCLKITKLKSNSTDSLNSVAVNRKKPNTSVDETRVIDCWRMICRSLLQQLNTKRIY